MKRRSDVAAVYIGLMSGTSLDGVDGVLVDFGGVTATTPERLPLRVLAAAHRAIPQGLAAELLALNAAGNDELHRAAIAANALAELYATVVADLLAASERAACDVSAIGAHGQTVRHRPGAFDGIGYTLQLNNPALLAERCGIDVVADFRSRDVAAGGQGAPLVPAFHRAMFGGGGGVDCVQAAPRSGDAQRTCAVLNLGGISNVTLFEADGSTTGFDCGPANALLDGWCRRHTGHHHDAGGAWAAGGALLPDLLRRLQQEPYFRQPPPKSTGRDAFSAAWLDDQLAALTDAQRPDPRDVQCTLAELTAWCCADALSQQMPNAAGTLLVCGGGALNDFVMRRLQAWLPRLQVHATDAAGLPSQQVEAAAFAWLAWRFTERLPGNLSSVTGAKGARVLGALYPA